MVSTPCISVGLVGLVLLFILPRAAGDCPPGWENHEPWACLKLFSDVDTKTAWHAQHLCYAHGGHLPEVVSKAQNDIFNTLRSTKEVWLGLTPKYTGWRWSVSNDKLSYINWSEGDLEPANVKDDACIRMGGADGKWFTNSSVDCPQVKLTVLCQKKPYGIEPTTTTTTTTTAAPSIPNGGSSVTRSASSSHSQQQGGGGNNGARGFQLSTGILAITVFASAALACSSVDQCCA